MYERTAGGRGRAHMSNYNRPERGEEEEENSKKKAPHDESGTRAFHVIHLFSPRLKDDTFADTSRSKSGNGVTFYSSYVRALVERHGGQFGG